MAWMPWAFLAVSIVGALFTWNALHPSHRWQLLAISFFAAWFTGELALWHLAWQAAATVVIIALGGLDAWPGWVALGITLVSWVGLLSMVGTSRSSARVMDDALREGLAITDRPVARGIPLRHLLLPLYLRDSRVERVKDLPYGPAGRRNLLDVYRPVGGCERAPVLLQIHGGAWIVGDKNQQGLPLMMEMAAQGWVAVSINYRLSPRAKWPEHLVDCKRALQWVREHIAEYGGDPDLVVVTGGSAGGHLTAMVALTQGDPEYQPGFEDADTSITAAVPFYGVYDLVGIFDRAGTATVPAEWLSKLIMPVTIREDRGAYEQASPMWHLRTDAPPMFVVHGAQDNLVPVEQARRFVAGLREVSSRPVLYAEIPGASHAFEVFHSVRTGNVVHGVARFLDWLVADVRARQAGAPVPPAEATGLTSDAASA